MRTKILTILLIFVGLGTTTTAFGQKQEQKKEKIMESEFGKIRAGIVRKACSLYGYERKDILDKIDNRELSTFYNALKNDTNPIAKKLTNILGNVPPIHGDSLNLEKLKMCRDSVSKYLLNVQKGCSDKDTVWSSEYKDMMDKLYNDCEYYINCEKEGNFSDYVKNYPNGVFKDIKEEKENSDAINIENNNNSTDFDRKTVFAIVIVFFCFIIIFILLRRYYCYYNKRLNLKKASSDQAYMQEKSTFIVDTTDTTKEDNIEDKSNDSKLPIDSCSQSHLEWLIVGASVKGNGHIQSNMPCQDNNKFESLGCGWGIAVVSDGAGSAIHAELGSKVVTERGIFHFKNLIEREGWIKSNILPSDIEWLLKSYYTLKVVRDDVMMVADKNKIEPNSLSATCLVVIYSPLGLLAVHVGDGRMGYKSKSGKWKSMMTPHKGDEANQTIFLISDFWTIPNYMMSGVLVPESIVIREPVKAFALMSDGCENTAWKCVIQNPETGKFYDRNEPFDGFFNPLEETLISLYANKIPDDERQKKWYKFLESGNNGFIKEQDDKTMIYGININL